MKNKIQDLAFDANLLPEVINSDKRTGVIIMCDHASNHVPSDLDNLGLNSADLEKHIGWDIGAESVTRKMCDMMGASAVIQKVSRLVIDVNREPDHKTLIPVESDGIAISGNRALGLADTQARVDHYYTPFHQAAAGLIQAYLDDGVIPLVIGMHSFTDVMHGKQRPWQIGFLWNKDPRLAQAMIGMLERETDLTIGDNEPYSGQDLYYTMQRHGADNGLAQTTVEIRQDLLKTDGECTQWAALMCDMLDEILERSDVRSIKYFD